jgi:hypothetical protein
MTAHTELLIRELTENAGPVRRLRSPFIRALMWLIASAAYIAMFVVIMPARDDLSVAFQDHLFLIEMAAAFATGLAAAVAAFATIVPGRRRSWAALPVGPLIVWLASLGPGCVHQLNQYGIQGLPLSHNPWCVPFIVLFGTVPAALVTVMLRRGAPLSPGLTATLGGLAAAGLANVGVRIVHPEDVSIMLLFWHVGSVIVLSAVAGAAGRRLFTWRALIEKSQVRA